MTVINAKAVADLREKTGAGMMDCKKALVETAGDLEAAVDFLRKKGLAATAKKAGRITAEGLVAVVTNGTTGAVLELNSETDFVAKNDKFQFLAASLAKNFIAYSGDFESFKTANTNQIAESIAVIGENMTLRRAEKLSVSKGAVISYVHNAIATGLGKIGVLVALESDASEDKLTQLGKQIAMHIAATRPESLNVSELDPALVAKERAFIVDQAKSSGKPDAVIEKMVEGRLVKFYEQVVLTEQLFVMDGKTRISQVIEDAGKQIGTSIKITGFIRYNIGEGIEKKEVDFAQEVAAAAAGA
jgi:elongation factor Ts